MREYGIVVVGGGSAGLAAAIAAREAGADDILLLERDVELGGILLQCIHNGFGLHVFHEELAGPSYAERYVGRFRELGIEYRTNAMVTQITPEKIVEYISPAEGCVRVKASAVILAMGCRERTRGSIRIPGFRPAGIWTAGTAQRYLNIEGYMVGRKVFILGSGDIGLIMARRLTLEGAEVLGVAELLPYSNGLPRNRKQCLEDFGIPLMLSHTVTDILGKDRLEGVVVSAVDAALQPIPGTERTYDADTLLLSVGLIPENERSEEAGVRIDPRTKGALVSESLETSVPGIFACGNVLHVHDLVDFVSEEGAKAGLAAAKYVKGELRHESAIYTEAGGGIGYVLPQSVHPGNCGDSLESMFRVSKPLRGAEIRIYRDGSLLGSVRGPHLAPAEMEKIVLTREEITGARESLRFDAAGAAEAEQGAGLSGKASPETKDVPKMPGSEESGAGQEMTCIVCPMGCRLTVLTDGSGQVISVTGNTCPRGETYARLEATAPERTVTSTVRLEGGIYRRLPVITSGTVPKERMRDVMREIDRTAVRAPVRIGDVLVRNVCGLGVDVVASRSMD